MMMTTATSDVDSASRQLHLFNYRLGHVSRVSGKMTARNSLLKWTKVELHSKQNVDFVRHQIRRTVTCGRYE